ncbi:hypothetical protein IP91_00766 [Pseudoduganella lurida]|uniref:CENP-V/GFA domain-containing protein n=1 Tax=Pseudoduganella lurida TaxID=1036180 RepID=A0A562RLC4_9BURK|nr:GFA family protein [Pseudoduganella lurida]TWI69693.1 hypothetical protein IP91_00766 [Pseudoduganella lurida]
MLKGSCLCGGVVYHADGKVRDASHCYCTMCQKGHGAGAGSYVNVGNAGLTYERGAELVTEFASSEAGRRGFCRVCGSTLYWRSTREPDNIAIALGTLEPEYDGPVQRELYTDTKPAWLPKA